MSAPNKFTSIEELDMFKKTEQLCDEIWGVAARWDKLAKDTVGRQLVRGADSIGANLAEGDGRYHFKEKLHFYYIARGSLKETCYWLHRAQNRHLLTPDQTAHLLDCTQSVHRWINSLISQRRQWTAQLRDQPEEYTIDEPLNP